MKNVTISIDDDLHRKARIYAAANGTSLSALVKDYLTALIGEQTWVNSDAKGVKEMAVSFAIEPLGSAGLASGKPRQPGRFRGLDMPDGLDAWPEDIMSTFEAWADYDDPEMYETQGKPHPKGKA